MPSELATRIRAKFPGAYDDMDDATLEKNVLAKHPEYQDLATPKPPESFIGSALKTLGHGALDALPGIGAVVGGVLSTPETGGIGTVPGIALGAGAGRGVRDIIAAGLGMEKPSTMGGEAAKIGGEAAMTGATAAVLPGVIAAAKAPIQTLREGAQQFGSAMPQSVRRLGNLFPSLPQSAAPVLERPAWQTWGEPPTAPAAASVNEGGLEAQLRAAGLDPSKMVSATPGAKQGATSMTSGRLVKMGDASRPPITVAPESPMQPPSPLQQPRAQVGAEVVGRQNGMSTQQVRDTTGPIRGEAPGAAAGMPSGPMDRIVQQLIDMGPKGQGLPESARESYAAAGTSDKTRLQAQAYLDALRKVGFVAPLAAAPSVRDLVMQKLRGDQAQ